MATALTMERMNVEAGPMQQPVRRAVGRPLSPSRQLACAETSPPSFANMPQDPSPEPKETISRFERLLADLARGEVDFSVVGGLAVILNGYPRLTLNAHILVNDASENIRRLLRCLERWGEGWARELCVEAFVPQEGSIRITEEFDLDVFTRMRGQSLDGFRPRLGYLEAEGARIPYLAPEDLIFLKQGSWGEKDQLDVLAMKEILERRRRQA